MVARLVFLFCFALTTGNCNAFQHFFVKLKEIGVLRSIFPDYVIFCGYDHIKWWDTNISSSLRLFLKVRTKKRIFLRRFLFTFRVEQKCCRKWRIAICLFDKSQTQGIILRRKGYLCEESLLRWIVIEQLKYKWRFFFVYVNRKKECSHNLKDLSKRVIVVRSEKMKAKYLKEYLWKSFFRNLAGWYLGTSLRKNFLTENIRGLRLNDYLPYFSFLCKNYLWNSYWICRLKFCNFYIKEALFQRCSIEKLFWKTSQNLEINKRSVLSKRCSIKYRKILRKTSVLQYLLN